MKAHRRLALSLGILATVLMLLLPSALLPGVSRGTPYLQGTLTPTAFLYVPLSARQYPLPTATPEDECSTAPTLISPASSSILNTLIPLFQWDSGSDPGATEFYLEVGQDPGFSDRVWGLRSNRFAQGVGEYRINMNLGPATTYYWRAYLRCGDTDGPYSEVWSFTTGSGGVILPAPDLLAPANGSTLAGTTVTLQWSPVSGAEDYWVWYSGGGWDRGTRVGEAQTILSDTLSPNTTYEWWVQARNSYALGLESAHWLFTTGEAEAP